MEIKNVPLLNLATVDFLQKIITKNFKILEIGSGSSTIWFAKRVKYIVSYEHIEGDDEERMQFREGFVEY